MTSQKDKKWKESEWIEKVRTIHESGWTKKPLREHDEIKGKYKVPHELKNMKGIKQGDDINNPFSCIDIFT